MTSDNTDKLKSGTKQVVLDVLIITATFFGLVFCAGVLVGFFSASGKHGGSVQDAAIGAVLVLVAGMCAWFMLVRTLRLLRVSMPKAGPSQSKVRQIWFFLIGLGAMIGAASALINIERGQSSATALINSMFGDAPIPPALATLMLAGLLVTAVITVLYYRNIDEHDRGAQQYASLVSINIYVLMYLGWWVAAKGGVLPAVNNALIFSVVITTFVIAWMWRRYR